MLCGNCMSRNTASISTASFSLRVEKNTCTFGINGYTKNKIKISTASNKQTDDRQNEYFGSVVSGAKGSVALFLRSPNEHLNDLIGRKLGRSNVPNNRSIDNRLTRMIFDMTSTCSRIAAITASRASDSNRKTSKQTSGLLLLSSFDHFFLYTRQ